MIKISLKILAAITISFTGSSCALLPGTFPTGSPNDQKPSTRETNSELVSAEIATDISDIKSLGRNFISANKATSTAEKSPAEIKEITREAALNATISEKRETDKIAVEQVKVAQESQKKRNISSASSKNEMYVVKSGDTLMKISYEKLGNIYRWREIYNANREKIRNYNQLVTGTLLLIRGVEYVVLVRNGQPYLIRKSDTLVNISKALYGTTAGWKMLWENNRQLIHDPNKIYAGFTLYYQKELHATPSRLTNTSSKNPDERKPAQTIDK